MGRQVPTDEHYPNRSEPVRAVLHRKLQEESELVNLKFYNVIYCNSISYEILTDIVFNIFMYRWLILWPGKESWHAPCNKVGVKWELSGEDPQRS